MGGCWTQISIQAHNLADLLEGWREDAGPETDELMEF
jgi:hypothetical protein